jgi:hypothetical protein
VKRAQERGENSCIGRSAIHNSSCVEWAYPQIHVRKRRRRQA